ncbi:hypothetical protein B7494_g2853 [Chlorociboria aeruginascens]|nr:hypothetical protein B7494_g2853 [Chlorociboria aeruginascens]
MPTKDESILGTGIWEGVKPDSNLSLPTRATKWCLDIVRPAYFSRSSGPRKPLRRTAYLDGLRGFAAFLVYWMHHQLWARQVISGDAIFENAFGYNGKYYFACLPGIRTFFSGGHYAVTVFFVISGYVLSAKPMSLIQSGEFLKLGDNLGSALFRRWLRLNIPVIVTTFAWMAFLHMFGIWQESPILQSSFREEVWLWYTEYKNFSFAFGTGGKPWFTYNFHVWSIPVEFKGSVIIYTALMAFSRCTRNARLWCQVGLIVYFMYIVDGWYGAMFISGMLLCDLDLLAASNNLPQIFSQLEPWKELIFFNLFIASIYLGGIPSHTGDVKVLEDSFGWYYLAKLKPQAVFDYKWFYLFWAATFMVACIPRLPWLKTFFETRFNQYLGRISFSFYLVHGPVLWFLGDRLYSATGWARKTNLKGTPQWVDIFPLPSGGPLGLEMSFLLPHLVLLPVTLWLAEMVTKLVDDPSVKFAQWLYGRTLAPAEKS